MHAIHNDKTIGVFVGESDSDGLASLKVEFSQGTKGVASGGRYGLIKQEAGFFTVGFDGDGNIRGAGFVRGIGEAKGVHGWFLDLEGETSAALAVPTLVVMEIAFGEVGFEV